MRRAALALALLAVAGLAAAGTAGPKPKVAIAGTWVSADSVRISASWSAVTDARGGPVTYSWSLVKDGAVAAGGSTTALTAVRTVARPLAGDTARYYAEVYAVDSRGKVSATARSPMLLVTTPWTPPAAPTVRLDTIPDSLVVLFVDSTGWAREYGFDALGKNVQACAILWYADGPRPAPDQPAICGQ